MLGLRIHQNTGSASPSFNKVDGGILQKRVRVVIKKLEELFTFPDKLRIKTPSLM